jgi:hypothetical protein
MQFLSMIMDIAKHADILFSLHLTVFFLFATATYPFSLFPHDIFGHLFSVGALVRIV